jgi:peptidylprolyl isomerase
MNKRIIKFFAYMFAFFIITCNSPAGNEKTIVFLKTSLGDIKIQLYDSTPIHRDNFIKLVNNGFYEGVTFHRVIKDFMIQAGDPNSHAGLNKKLLDSLNAYTIPAEFKKEYYHRKGALAAARQGNDVNPQMRSSGTQFYIVQGIKYNDSELNIAEQRINSNIKQAVFNKFIYETTDSAKTLGITLSNGDVQEKASQKMFHYIINNEEYKILDDQRIVYESIGGAPLLDGTYTVFGEVIEGLDVIDKIASVKTDNNDKPLSEILIIKIKIVKK